MSTTEEQIAAAFAAEARGITMGTSTIERRLAEVRDRGVQDRRRRRRVAVGATVLATAAAVTAAVVLSGEVLDVDRALPPAQEAPVEVVPLPPGSGNPEPGTYAVSSTPDFTFTLPPQGDVPGRWHYEYDADSFGVGFDLSQATGHANVSLRFVDQVHQPGGPLPYAADAPLVAAPADVDGWVDWLEDTGAVQVTEREEVEVDGATATRLSLDVADDIPSSGFPCAPGESCVPVHPDGPSLVASSRGASVTTEMTLVPVDDRLLVAVALGRSDTADQWLPLMRSIVESVDVQ